MPNSKRQANKSIQKRQQIKNNEQNHLKEPQTIMHYFTNADFASTVSSNDKKQNKKNKTGNGSL